MIDLYILNIDNFDENSLYSNLPLEVIIKSKQLKSKKKIFLASEWLKRYILSKYLKCIPKTIKFKYTYKGKPYLHINQNIDFNISHSKNYIAIAVTKGRLLGLDIQFMYNKPNFINISKRYFNDIEHRWLSQLSKNNQKYYFYLLWTLKEASLKLTGEGLPSGLSRFSFIFKNKQIIQLKFKNTQLLHHKSFIIQQDILCSLACSHIISSINSYIVELKKISKINLLKFK